MTDLTNFTDTSDVSDAAIEWVRKELGGAHYSIHSLRAYAARGDEEDRTIILAARLIQQHRPDLLVVPVAHD